MCTANFLHCGDAGHPAEQGQGGVQRPPARRGGEDQRDQADHQEPAQHGRRRSGLQVFVFMKTLFIVKTLFDPFSVYAEPEPSEILYVQ